MDSMHVLQGNQFIAQVAWQNLQGVSVKALRASGAAKLSASVTLSVPAASRCT